MSSQTPNLNLVLPVGTEKVSRQIINDNNTKIDTAVGANSEAIANLPTYNKLSNPVVLCNTNSDISNAIASAIAEMENSSAKIICLNVNQSGLNLPGGRWTGLLNRGVSTYYNCIFTCYSDNPIYTYVYASGTETWKTVATSSVVSVQNIPFSTGVYYCSNSQTFGSVTIPSYCIYDLHVLGTNGVGYATRVTNGAFYVLYGSSSAWNAISK